MSDTTDPALGKIEVMGLIERSWPTLRPRLEFDRQDNFSMESEYFHSFQHFEPEIRSEEFFHAHNLVHDRGPDFRVVVNGRTLGVELTRIFKMGIRGIESTEEKIYDEACRRAHRLGLPSADVCLFFSVQEPLNARARMRIADAVVRIVAEQMPEAGCSVQIEGISGQPHEVDLILISRVDSRSPARWDFDTSGIVDGSAARSIQDAIDRKVHKFSGYLKCCDECWLLVVADSFRSSARFSMDGIAANKFTSPFARTYFLDFGKGRNYRLQAEPA